MFNHKLFHTIMGILFAAAALFFAGGTINHIMRTHESVVSSVLLSLGCLGMSIFYFRRQQ